MLSDTIRQGMGPVLVGVGVGVGAFPLSRTMMALLYEVTATDPGVYASVAALVVLTGVGAIMVPARRATRMDPVSALRQDA